jgi:hypothetical protein
MHPFQPLEGVNLLCELDSPGEYYIDDGTGMLYFYPPLGSEDPTHWLPGAATISVNTTAISLNSVRNLVLHGLTVTGSVHTGIEGSNVTLVEIINCTVAGHGRHGMVLGFEHLLALEDAIGCRPAYVRPIAYLSGVLTFTG